MKQVSPFVITISRQLGSGGAYLGQQLAKILNIYYADQEIITRAAKQLSVLEEDIEFRDEKKLSFWKSYLQSYSLPTIDNYASPQYMIPSDRELFQEEAKIIELIAKERSAVIIGRCGFHILREHPNHISLFIHSSIPFRIERIQKLYNVSADAARNIIARNDKDRAYYNQAFTGKEWIDARQYDISIDTSKIGLDNSINLILNYLELR